MVHSLFVNLRLKMELENLSSEHKEIIAQLQLNHAEKINALKEQLQEAESNKSKAEKEV